MKSRFFSLPVSILVILFTTTGFGSICASDDSDKKEYVLITIRHWQYFDSSKGSIIFNEKEGIASGDFRFESTSYQYGNIGSINGNFLISMKPYKDVTVSRMKKIENADFDSVTRTVCSNVEYDQFDEQILGVNDGDVFCLSLDRNRDGVYGDSYLKLNILSHTDSNEGNYAGSVTFVYKVF
jgi:hypothetical protein